jgi:hypothetical protein
VNKQRKICGDGGGGTISRQANWNLWVFTDHGRDRSEREKEREGEEGKKRGRTNCSVPASYVLYALGQGLIGKDGPRCGQRIAPAYRAKEKKFLLPRRKEAHDVDIAQLTRNWKECWTLPHPLELFRRELAPPCFCFFLLGCMGDMHHFLSITWRHLFHFCACTLSLHLLKGKE